jgi:UPF0271 protein
MPELEIDVGELPDEPPELVALAHRVNVACGGHAGDDDTARSVLRRAIVHVTRVGAHPSYVDRAGFGRTAQDVPLTTLEAQIFEQCAWLRAHADALGVRVEHVKPHGALYHRAAADPGVAAAVLDGALRALGTIAVIGPGALAALATRRGLLVWRERYADRGLAAAGSLLPRGTPGATFDDPARAVAQALAEPCDMVCVHGDGANAVAIARAVRAALDDRAHG